MHIYKDGHSYFYHQEITANILLSVNPVFLYVIILLNRLVRKRHYFSSNALNVFCCFLLSCLLTMSLAFFIVLPFSFSLTHFTYCAGNIYTMAIGKCYKSRSCFLPCPHNYHYSLKNVYLFIFIY